jgi:hypothetical protein
MEQPQGSQRTVEGSEEDVDGYDRRAEPLACTDTLGTRQEGPLYGTRGALPANRLCCPQHSPTS